MTDQSDIDPKIPDPIEYSRNMVRIAEKSRELVSDFLSRHPVGGLPEKNDGPVDPLNVGAAFFEMTRRMMEDPAKLVQAQIGLWQDYVALWQHATRQFLGAEEKPLIEPKKDDWRFRDAAWSENALFDYIKQSYLLTARWMQSTVRDVTMAPGMGNRPIGVFSTFFPAKSAQLELSGRFAPGTPWPEMRGDRQSTSACLAWSETWVKPRA
jgi:polyhydroxyalkanoate synthase